MEKKNNSFNQESMEKRTIDQWHVELANGDSMPRLCFGTWQIPEGEEAYQAVRDALEVGYRHIDTAFDYGNEKSVGKAIRDSGIPRQEIFVTTKLSASVKEYNEAKKAIEQSLKNLNIGYVDQYIIHAPWPWDRVGANFSKENVDVYRAMEEAFNKGKFRHIGLSNFDILDIQHIIINATVKPSVNQIKLHVGNYPHSLMDFCREDMIAIMGYSTLGTREVLDNPVVKGMAGRYNVTPSQLCIKYSLQHEAAPIVKSLNKKHMRDNLKLDFSIFDEDMHTLDHLKGIHSDYVLPYENR